MTYPLFAGSPSETVETTSQVVGGDTQFLVDAEGGFFVADIKLIASMVESDCYYDGEPSRMDDAMIYLLSRGDRPTQVVIRYYVTRVTEAVIYKTVNIFLNEEGGVASDLLASAPYEIHK